MGPAVRLGGADRRPAAGCVRDAQVIEEDVALGRLRVDGDGVDPDPGGGAAVEVEVERRARQRGGRQDAVRAADDEFAADDRDRRLGGPDGARKNERGQQRRDSEGPAYGVTSSRAPSRSVTDRTRTSGVSAPP